MANIMHSWGTRAGAALAAVALLVGSTAPALARNPGDDPQPDPGRIRLTVAWADPATVGRFIGDGLMTVVQYQDAAGQWQDVLGWRQPLVNTNTVLWNVLQRDWGKGPFRWVVRNRAKGYDMASSTGFNLPITGQYLDISVVIPANPAPPGPLTSPLPAELIAGATQVRDPNARPIVLAQAVNVRREADLAAYPFAELRKGVTAQILRTTVDGQWLYVRADGVEGWIPLVGGLTVTPLSGLSVRIDPTARATVVADYVDVYQAPSLTSFPFAEFRRGVVAQVLGASPDRQWILASADGVKGWLRVTSRLSLTAAVSRVRPVSDYPVATVAVRRLTIRTLPSADAPAVDILLLGDEVEVMAASLNGSWFNIRYGTTTGWVFAESTLSY